MQIWKSDNIFAFTKNNAPKVSRYNTFYFLRYARLKYVKYLFTKIRKQ